MNNIAIYCDKKDVNYDQVKETAKQLSIDIISDSNIIEHYDYLLIYYKSDTSFNSSSNSGSGYLSLVNIRDKDFYSNNKIKKYIYVDYINNTIAGKKIYKFNNSDPIAKAFGLKNIFKLEQYQNNTQINILDGTAGFTFDSYGLWLLYSSLNYNISISLVENSKVIYYLVKDGLIRAGLENKIYLYNNSLIEFLKINKKNYDIIYLDPMFDLHAKAKPQENMQVLQDLCYNPSNIEELLTTALIAAKYKVILKRAKKHPQLYPEKINYSAESKQIRYDVYLV